MYVYQLGIIIKPLNSKLEICKFSNLQNTYLIENFKYIYFENNSFFTSLSKPSGNIFICRTIASWLGTGIYLPPPQKKTPYPTPLKKFRDPQR